METCPAARFTIAAGIKNGEILRGPPSIRCGVFALDNVEPANAGANMHADVFGIFRRDYKPDIWMASSAAEMAKWMKRPIFLASFFSMSSAGRNS